MKTDIQIQKDVMEELRWEPALNSSQFGVAVKNGVVTLAGQVNTYFEKSIAERAAKRVAGVRALAEDIIVGDLPSYEHTDSEIARAILDALHWNSAVLDEKIKVNVEDGIVRLEGETEWDFQRTQAKKIIEKISGVKMVLNYVALKSKPTPADLQERIKDALARSAIINSKKIMVDVVGNKIILRGEVTSLGEKEDAEAVAWSAPGVAIIENKLHVNGVLN